MHVISDLAPNYAGARNARICGFLMTTIKTDFVGRVRRLPDPRNTAEALQPLFEAVMNAVHSTQDKFQDEVGNLGKIHVTVTKKEEKNDFSIIVADNGNGLNKQNYDAFLTTDTEHKKVTRGGKGVGRLLWLACFEEINVSSDFIESEQKKRRQFKFALKESEKI
jgi:light-regulated signal transduction histidine kinase (bacteriophytochrome)